MLCVTHLFSKATVTDPSWTSFTKAYKNHRHWQLEKPGFGISVGISKTDTWTTGVTGLRLPKAWPEPKEVSGTQNRPMLLFGLKPGFGSGYCSHSQCPMCVKYRKWDKQCLEGGERRESPVCRSHLPGNLSVRNKAKEKPTPSPAKKSMSITIMMSINPWTQESKWPFLSSELLSTTMADWETHLWLHHGGFSCFRNWDIAQYLSRAT